MVKKGGASARGRPRPVSGEGAERDRHRHRRTPRTSSRGALSLRWLLLILLAGVLGAVGEAVGQSGGTTGGLTHNPTEVVRRYLTLDSKGARLGPSTYEALSPYVAWGPDPVWGRVVVIEGFTIAEDVKQWEVVDNLEVVIPVTFTVLGSVYYETASFVADRTTEEVRVRVKAIRNRWRIVEPIFPPHVGQKRMTNHVQQAWLDETDLRRREQLSALRDAIKHAKKDDT